MDCPGTTHFLKIDFDRFFGVSWVRLCQVVTDFQFTFYIKSKQNVCVIPVQWATLTVLDSRNQWECVSELNDTTFHNTLMYTQLLSYNRRHSNFDHQKMLAPSSFSRHLLVSFDSRMCELNDLSPMKSKSTSKLLKSYFGLSTVNRLMVELICHVILEGRLLP